MRFKRKLRSRSSRKISVTAFFVAIALMGIGYAYVNSNLNVSGATKITKSSWDIHFENINTINGTLENDETIKVNSDNSRIDFKVNLETIQDYYQINVNVVNTGEMDAMVNSIELTELTEAQKEYLEFYATYNDGSEIKLNDKLYAGNYDVISIVIKYKDGIDYNTINKKTDYLTLSMTLNYGQATKEATDKGKNLINEITKEVQEDKEIDFTLPSSNKNGKGLYLKNDTEEDTYPIFYYRGNVDNNYVTFNNICWRIVRTTETGGIKLIYSGNPNEEGACVATSTNLGIENSFYNAKSDDNAYVGFMFGYENSSTKDLTHLNENNSLIKESLNNFYKNNLIKVENKIEDTNYINDRSITSGKGSSKDTTIYSANKRLEEGKVNLKSEKSDNFTKSNINGNKKLSNPIGLLSVDEMILAGSSNESSNNYLAGIAFWSMSPSRYNASAQVFAMNATGEIIDATVTSNYAVRPVITLKNGIKFTDGDGSKSNPYLIK